MILTSTYVKLIASVYVHVKHLLYSKQTKFSDQF